MPLRGILKLLIELIKLYLDQKKFSRELVHIFKKLRLAIQGYNDNIKWYLYGNHKKKKLLVLGLYHVVII